MARTITHFLLLAQFQAGEEELAVESHLVPLLGWGLTRKVLSTCGLLGEGLQLVDDLLFAHGLEDQRVFEGLLHRLVEVDAPSEQTRAAFGFRLELHFVPV